MGKDGGARAGRGSLTPPTVMTSLSQSGEANDLQSYFARTRANRALHSEPPHMGTPQTERGVLEHAVNEDDPKKRMEWQKMLHSVLESEVLSSETKRITAAEAKALTPSETMAQVWLSLHALCTGRGAARNDTAAQETIVRELRARTVPPLIRDILAWRKNASAKHSQAQPEVVRTSIDVPKVSAHPIEDHKFDTPPLDVLGVPAVGPVEVLPRRSHDKRLKLRLDTGLGLDVAVESETLDALNHADLNSESANAVSDESPLRTPVSKEPNLGESGLKAGVISASNLEGASPREANPAASAVASVATSTAEGVEPAESAKPTEAADERPSSALEAPSASTLVPPAITESEGPMWSSEEQRSILEECEALLDRVEAASALFPSRRQLIAAFPEWHQTRFQRKLSAMSAWCNMTRALQAQNRLLKGWIGSLTSPGGALRTPTHGDIEEDGALVERIFRGGTLQQTFERGTLSMLYVLVDKTRVTLRLYHSEFAEMHLPSFEPDVLPLVRFPMWLAEGALRQRLEYADKLREPSVLLVESLADDLRGAIALACRIKRDYTQLTVPEPESGWTIPLESDERFDAAVCRALHFFFQLLHFRLKSAYYFKEIDVLEPEWDFLCGAVRIVPGGDVIVAHKTASMVNRLFARVITYFQRELQAPTTKSDGRVRRTTGGPSMGGRLTEGRVVMSVPDMTRWIHTVFSTARVRSRRLTGFARRIRGMLETSAEYDLRALRAPNAPMDLHAFLQRLLHADYFLVYTSSFEERGVFVLAEPSLHDQPETIQALLFECVRAQPADTAESDSARDEMRWSAPLISHAPQYLVLLSPREPFLWTGRVMNLPLPWIDVDLKQERLRVIADGTEERLERCKQHFLGQFAPTPPSNTPLEAEAAPTPSSVPLTPVYERRAHLALIHQELKLMSKGGYVLTDTIVHAVPSVRRQMQRMRPIAATPADRTACDELVQTCFLIAMDQGARALGYIESPALHGHLSAALAQLAIEWIAFICEDCVLTERHTFKWAVAALEHAMNMTSGEGIFLLSEQDFGLLRSKVSSCMALLISHFDILGARSNALKAEVEAPLRRARNAAALDVQRPGTYAEQLSAQRMQALQEREEARETALKERRLIGRVLDDTRLEDRGLQLLASKGVQMRWQQGRFIGGGTFGSVYLAVNLDTGGLMAVKEIRFQELTSTPGLYKQIHDEMHVMEMLRHPNIVEYYGIEVHRDKVYIFEEYCQGGSLAQLLEHGRIEDEIVLQVYTLQMLDGLMYLHSKGVVHRDIKPDNILLDHMGVIKFVDFGAAKVFSRSSRTIQRSRRMGVPTTDAAGQSLQGTPMYMSPEVIKGEHNGREGAMDIWSLGCVILECAKGTRPWSQLDNEWAIMFHIGMAKQHPPLPDESQLSPLGIDFIERCLTIDPFKRPSAVELRDHAWIRELVDELNAESDEPQPTHASDASPRAAAAQAEREAAATASPASRTLPPPNFGSLRIPSPRQQAAPQAAETMPAGITSVNMQAETEPRVAPVPGIPDHRHPGYEAIIADKQYRREEEQIKAMLEPDSPHVA